MESNEEDISSQFSSEKTNTSSYNDDTLTQEVNTPLFPKIRPRAIAKPLSNSVNPGHSTMYIPSSKINEINIKKKKFGKFKFFGKSKKNNSTDQKKDETELKAKVFDNSKNKDSEEQEKVDDNININNYESKAFETKKLKSNKKLNKNNTINYCSPANEFQKTMFEQKNFISDTNETNFGITLKSLEEQWKYQKILLDYNILDFTSK